MIQIYTGNGKGKTTAALGLSIRALGRNKRVCLIQFMKNNFDYGEIRILKQLSNIEIRQFGTDKLVDPNHPEPIDFQEAENAYQAARQVLRSRKYDLVVLDEINVAVNWGLLEVEKQLLLMNENQNGKELVMTGRYAHEKVIEKADLVTEMKEIRHYFNKGFKAREGIEY